MCIQVDVALSQTLSACVSLTLYICTAAHCAQPCACTPPFMGHGASCAPTQHTPHEPSSNHVIAPAHVAGCVLCCVVVQQNEKIQRRVQSAGPGASRALSEKVANYRTNPLARAELTERCRQHEKVRGGRERKQRLGAVWKGNDWKRHPCCIPVHRCCCCWSGGHAGHMQNDRSPYGMVDVS